ncbi:capsular polysaccharide export protein, LipB/KpsS family [Paracoccus sp. T5]|uniref:capsular polysaccharide export protein, LipB/KpsS family n=1 Tax=Paracoccus sp. T5 TaxID=3402161 RepID=UPI003AE7856A
MPDRTPRVVALEIPEAWFRDPGNGGQHQMFYASLLSALAELGVLVRPLWMPRGADRAPRSAGDSDLLISFHSYGAAEGDVLRCKESYLPPYYTMDPQGYACFSQLARDPGVHAKAVEAQDPHEARAFVQNLSEELRRTNLSKYPQSAEPVQIRPGYLFVPLQVVQDSVARGAWLGVEEALKVIVAAAADRGLRTVVKRHPRCSSARIARLLRSLPQDGTVELSQASVQALVAGAELVVGANSGVLFEALLQGKPVISYAEAEFGQITHQVRTADALAQAIRVPRVPDAGARDKFLHWYLTRYCVRADDVPAIRRRIRAALDAGLEAGAGRAAALPSWKLYAYSLFDRTKRRLF